MVIITESLHSTQGQKDDNSICGVYLSLAYAGQRKQVLFLLGGTNINDR